MNVNYHLSISKDQLAAYLTVRDDFSSQAVVLTEDTLRCFLFEQGIVFGILDEKVLQVVKQGFCANLLIAKGISPLRGANAYYESLVASRQEKYRELCATFQNLENISASDFRPILVHARRPVLKKHVATRGAPGLSVKGELLLGLWGDDAKPPAMENLTPCPENKNIWLAACKGVCLFELPEYIEIRPVLLLERDLNESLSFDGIVVIFGHVADAVRLRASDDIFITRVVEGAVVLSKGNIFLQQGVKGKYNAVLKSEGNLQLVFAEHATLEVGAELQAKSLSLCHTYSLGNCFVDHILGGQTFSGQNVFAKSLGSRGVFTEVAAAYLPYLDASLKQINDQVLELKTRLSTLEETLADPLFLIDAKKQILRQHYYYQRPCLTYALQKKTYTQTFLEQLVSQQCQSRILIEGEIFADTLISVGKFEYYQDAYSKGNIEYHAGRYGVIVTGDDKEGESA